VTELTMLITAVWVVEHQVDLFAALAPGGRADSVGAGIITFFERPGQSMIDALDAALLGKSAVPIEMKATLRELDKLS